MAWIRVDDHFDEHPKLAKVGPVAWGYWLAGLAYCNRNLTDGFIPWSKARALCSFEVLDDQNRIWHLSRGCGMQGDDMSAEWIIDLLIGAELWKEVEGGYRVHDYDQYQPSREQVEADRERNAKRQAEWRARNAGSNADSNAVTNRTVTTPPNPNPNPNPNPLPKPRPKNVTPPIPPIGGESPKPKTIKTPIPDDLWERIPEHIKQAMAIEQKMTDVELAFETSRMIDYYRSKGERRADWDATWRNWMRSDYRKPRGSPTPIRRNGAITPADDPNFDPDAYLANLREQTRIALGDKPA